MKGSPTGISSEGCVPAPLSLLDDSPTSMAAAGVRSTTTRPCLGTDPELQQKQRYQTASSATSKERDQNHSMGYLTSLLALLFRTVVLGFLGQLVPASGSGLLSRLMVSTPPALPFISSATITRSSESELDRVYETSRSKSGLNS